MDGRPKIAMRWAVPGVLVAIAAIGAACTSNTVAAVPAADGGTGRAISFKTDLQPILDENCVACHQSGSAEQGLVLEDSKAHADLVRVPSHEAKLALVTPGAPEASYLLRKLEGSHIEAGGSGARMPLGDPLDPKQVMMFRKWIAAGAENN
jgi:mono/diheme cytochrome c family protein